MRFRLAHLKMLSPEGKKNIFICIINVQTRPINKTYNAKTRYSLSHTDSRKLFKAAFSFFV